MEKVVARKRFIIVRIGDKDELREVPEDRGVLERVYISEITKKGDLRHLPYIDLYLN